MVKRKKKWFGKAVRDKPPYTLGGWKKTYKPETRRRLALASRPPKWSLYRRYLSAGRALVALANVTKDMATIVRARADARYFFSKAKKIKPKHNPGKSSIGRIKGWVKINDSYFKRGHKNKLSGEIVSIGKLPKGRGWVVYTPTHSKKRDTLPEARSYANSYMRSHPGKKPTKKANRSTEKIKGWKKVSSLDGSIIYENKKTGKYLDIINVYPLVPMGCYAKPVYKVRTPERRDYKSGFKTKSQAHNYAINWMRKHPQG